MQSDAEHQQDDTEFRQLRSDIAIGRETRRKRPDQHAGRQIADKRRQMQPVGQISEQRRRNEADGNRGYQCDIVMHALPQRNQ